MLGLILLVSGIIILTTSIYDFFFTTLSGTGSSLITKTVSSIVHSLSLSSIKFFKRRLMGHFGMLINLSVLLVWILFFWLGIFMIFSSDPASIVTKDKEVASAIERLYFSGFIFSTLGVGDIQPASDTFRVLSIVFSFLGFSFFTTSITYLISVFSALTYKRSLSQSIRNFGNSPDEVMNNLFSYQTSFLFQQLLQIQNMLDNQIVNHQAYPVLNFYNSISPANSLNLNLVVLDEAISMYMHQSAEKPLIREIQPLRDSISNYNTYIITNHLKKESETPFIDWGKLDQNLLFGSPNKINEALVHRRKELSRLLFNSGFSWRDVYPGRVLSQKTSNIND
jgi:hypothetical protein